VKRGCRGSQARGRVKTHAENFQRPSARKNRQKGDGDEGGKGTRQQRRELDLENGICSMVSRIAPDRRGGGGEIEAAECESILAGGNVSAEGGGKRNRQIESFPKLGFK